MELIYRGMRYWSPDLKVEGFQDQPNVPQHSSKDHASHWARGVAIGMVNAGGFDCLLKVNDDVLVAFEHGVIHRPYVLSSVWNSRDAPPVSVQQSVQDGKVRLRTFKTPAGHQLQFIDDDRAGNIHLKTACR